MKPKPEHSSDENKLSLHLYVSGMSSKSMDAIENIKAFCEEYLDEEFELGITDIYKHPQIAFEQQIVFSPSLVKTSPLPRKILIGTFSDPRQLIKALGINIKEQHGSGNKNS
jgi:circadian clock protein KaiB